MVSDAEAIRDLTLALRALMRHAGMNYHSYRYTGEMDRARQALDRVSHFALGHGYTDQPGDQEGPSWSPGDCEQCSAEWAAAKAKR